MQPAIGVSPAKSVKAAFDIAVLYILRDDERIVEKYLLNLHVCDAVFLVLSGIAIIPIKANVRHRDLRFTSRHGGDRYAGSYMS
jgi:hypothetical protein